MQGAAVALLHVHMFSIEPVGSGGVGGWLDGCAGVTAGWVVAAQDGRLSTAVLCMTWMGLVSVSGPAAALMHNNSQL